MIMFVCNVKKYRENINKTQKDLANRVGVRRETIVRLEASKYNPSLKLAIDIARVLDAHVEDLFIFE